ncbi:MAG: UPF0182 family protein [Symploca sp. SIO2C1]|nr:UPF0182 family protein [Symploca sp. SIO2C1]
MVRGKKNNSRPSSTLLPILIIAALILFSSSTVVHLITEVWWFEAVGFAEVFWTQLIWRSLVWLGTFVVFALFLWGNYHLAMRFTPTEGGQFVFKQRYLRSRSLRFLEIRDLDLYVKSLPNYIALVAILLTSLIAASSSIGTWETIVKYLNAKDFGSVDPIYQRDIGFYIFQLPFYEGIRDWLLALLIGAVVVSVIVYILKGSINTAGSFSRFISGKPKIHLSILLAVISVLVAISFWLGRYHLLYSEEGVVFGAGYTDVHARLAALSIMSFLALALAFLFLLGTRQNTTTLPVYGMGLFIVALVLLRGIYPWFQQQFIVEPNELAKEKSYIAHNIQLTRQAYGLDVVQTEQYPAKAQLNRQVLQENQSTIGNIRLWDYRPLLSTYRQLQEIRLYYRFRDIDIDRYTLDGNYQQVMLAPRELSYDQVPQRARTWVNQRLKYTHGYGLVMSPVNRVTSQGLPEFLIKDIPPASEVDDLQVTRPEIYYGEETDTYIFTGTSTDEFDYPSGGENASNRYEGKGGVPMGSLLRKLAYAYDLSSLKILISNYFTKESRIHYYRQIKERVSQVAPFLRLDNDSYITLIDGKLQWVLDAYTVSDRYPYSEPFTGDNRNFNYIRNSVKVLVDAYDGTMQFFVVDENDPILASYRQIFPKLFTSSETVPPQVREHFRYPLDLFKIQAQMYLSYHMSDAEVFYNQEDLWRLPTEVYEGNQQLMEPYYMIMRLPEGQTEEFILILPFTPGNKDNMVAWMAAHSNSENYGKLLLYEFPKQQLVYGPKQVEARIDQNPQISQQLTLWSQQGSKVIRGDLLVIPIQESLLYVEPIYLRAEQGELPELKRVIVAYDEEIVMEESLEQALVTMFGKEKPQQQPQPVPVPKTEVPANLAQSALETYNKAQKAAQEGNWADFGRYQKELEEILKELNSGKLDAPKKRSDLSQ